MKQFQVERVHCCVCDGTGKTRFALLFKRRCAVCEGEGKRPIILPADAPEDMKQMFRVDAIQGINRFYNPDPYSFLGFRI